MTLEHRIAVLASGRGSILEALLATSLPITCVLADRPCAALGIAEAVGVPAKLVERSSYRADFDRHAYTTEVIEVLQGEQIDLVVLAGFMTIFDAAFVDAWPGRILNTHPSLLPSFPGAHPVRDAMSAGVKVTGCTVHIVTAGVDAGPIVAQQAVPVLPGDDESSLHERIKQVERGLLPKTIEEFLQ